MQLIPVTIWKMRWGRAIIVCFCLVIGAVCADQPQNVPLLPCREGAPGAPNCNPSKQELREAKSSYEAALKLQRAKRTEEAFHKFEEAAQLAPRHVDYLTAREMSRQQLVYEYLQRGNASMLAGKQVEAVAEFRSALNLDPDNVFAQQRMYDVAAEWAPKLRETPRVIASADEVAVDPRKVHADFHYTGDSVGLLTLIGNVYGVAPTIDESVKARNVRFDITDVNFYQAMQAVALLTHTFWVPLSEKQFLVAADTAENHRQFDRMGLRTFYIPTASNPQALNDVTNLLRQIFEIRFVTPQPRSSQIEVRAPMPALEAATQVIEGLADSRPQVIFDIDVYEISHTLMRNIGLHIPNQSALAALGGQNIQDLINQLIATGGINQNSQALSALLAQLGSQRNSIFSQPLATFGSGLTLFGLSLDNAIAQLSLNESSIKSLEHATLRADQGYDANLHIGTRFPILNASFAPIFNTPAIAQNIQNNTFQSAFPSFNYEDLGLSVKAKPFVNSSSVVSLQLEMQVRALGTTSLNGVPVITNREYKGSSDCRFSDA